VAAQVEVTHLGKKKRKYRVKGLEQAANRLMFRNEQENRDMSVAEYFEATYHIKCEADVTLTWKNGGLRAPAWRTRRARVQSRPGPGLT